MLATVEAGVVCPDQSILEQNNANSFVAIVARKFVAGVKHRATLLRNVTQAKTLEQVTWLPLTAVAVEDLNVAKRILPVAMPYLVVAADRILEGAVETGGNIIDWIHHQNVMGPQDGEGINGLAFQIDPTEVACEADGAHHYVEPGNTLGGIADQHGVDVNQLAGANGYTLDPINHPDLNPPESLSVGSCLTLPGKVASTPVPNATVVPVHTPLPPEATPFPGGEAFCEVRIPLSCDIPHEIFGAGDVNNAFQSLAPNAIIDGSASPDMVMDYNNYVNRFLELIMNASNQGAVIATADESYLSDLTGRPLAEVHNVLVECLSSTRSMVDGNDKQATINACTNLTVDNYDGRDGVSIQEIYKSVAQRAFEFKQTERRIRDTTITGTLYGGEEGKGISWLVPAGIIVSVVGLFTGLRAYNAKLIREREERKAQQEREATAGAVVIEHEPISDPEPVAGEELYEEVSCEPDEWEEPFQPEDYVPKPIITKKPAPILQVTPEEDTYVPEVDESGERYIEITYDGRRQRNKNFPR